jgi:Ran GTPase-activating protein (RanGAP) involved in mRNA processing and transport
MALNVPWGPFTSSAAASSDASPQQLKTLDMRGPRGGLSADKAREFVAPVTSGAATDYERVILSTWAFSEESARVVADALRLLPALRSAVLADIIAGRPEAEGLAVYRALGEALKDVLDIEEIDISDNAVGTKGVEACRPFLSNRRNLRRLFVCNCGISAEALRSIADILLHKTPTELRVLHFHNNMSGGGGAAALADIVAASPHLEDFRFSSSRGTRDGGEPLARAFAACASSLRSLNLHDNLFSVPTAVELGVTLRRLRGLVVLNVGDTLLKDEGMAALASGLVRGCANSLEVLDVSANELTPEGAKALARVVRRMTRLRALHAQENEFEDEGAAFIARGIHRRPQFRAATAGTAAAAAAGAAAAAASSAAAGGAAAAAAAAGELSPDSLAVIDLSDCMMTSKGARTVSRACASHLKGSLSTLKLEGNELTAKGIRAVKGMLEAAGLGDAVKELDEKAADEEGDDDDEDEDDGEGEGAGADDAESDVGEEGPGEAPEEEKPDAAVDAVADMMKAKLAVETPK